MREGDLLLLATDGVFDNLFEDEIVEMVSKLSKSREKTVASAKSLA